MPADRSRHSLYPDTAAPGELARYGCPSRPDAADGPEALASWRMATAQRLERVVPSLLRTNRYHLPITAVSVDAVSGTIGSLDWSGYALGGRGRADLYSALGHWTIPTVQQRFRTCSSVPVYSAQWVGIDGFSNDYLLQSGSEADAYCDNGRQRGEASLLFSAAQVGGSKVLGRSAEWIVERPLVDNKLAELANYTANPWTLVYAYDLRGHLHTPAAPGAATTHNITMVDHAGAPISYVKLYGNSALWFYNDGPSR